MEPSITGHAFSVAVELVQWSLYIREQDDANENGL